MRDGALGGAGGRAVGRCDVTRLGFVHGDPRMPLRQPLDGAPAARWHDEADGPVQYLCDTPDGAWAELLRHEEITDPADLPGVRRRIWAVEVDAATEREAAVVVPPRVATGDAWSYPACRAAARALRVEGVTCVTAPSAALAPGGGRGQPADGSGGEAPDRDPVVWALSGPRPAPRAWAVVDTGSPTARVLALVVPYGGRQERPAQPGDRRRGDRRRLIDVARAERGEPERRADFLGDRRTDADPEPPAPPRPPGAAG